jgi:hypothetical protein
VDDRPHAARHAEEPCGSSITRPPGRIVEPQRLQPRFARPRCCPSSSASSSRPPSPPPADTPPLVLDFSVFLLVLERELPRPSAPDGLAGEAVDEAIERVRALGNWLVRGFGSSSSSGSNGVSTASALAGFLSTPSASGARQRERRTTMTTTTRGMARSSRSSSRSSSSCAIRLGVESGAAAFLGMDEELYKRRCLGGFGRADEWACAVGRAVCDGLKAQTQTHDAGAVVGVGEDKKQIVREWIKARVEG